jgi:hypothetical protein
MMNCAFVSCEKLSNVIATTIVFFMRHFFILL